MQVHWEWSRASCATRRRSGRPDVEGPGLLVQGRHPIIPTRAGGFDRGPLERSSAARPDPCPRYNVLVVTKGELEAELHTAMRSGDDVRKRTLRMILSAVKLAEVEKRGELDEAEMQAVLQREVKTRHEAIAEAEKAQRPDLAEAARAELAVVQVYLPAQLSPDEIEQLARQAIAASGAAGPQDMGKVMKDIMPRVQGRADGKAVNEIVRRLLNPA